MDAYAVNFFFARDLTELPPARERQPGWKVRNWSDDFHGIAGAAGEVNDALMDEKSLEWIDSAGVQTRECQDSQAQSIETRFAPTL